jgi:hypothetical protein
MRAGLRNLAAFAILAALSGCAAPQDPEATPQEIAARSYSAPGPKTITVITMINNQTGSGGHTALMINGSQKVIFDPAGSFRDPRVVERGDVIYGITPAWEQAYKAAHARSTYHVVLQEIAVSAEQAEAALGLAMSNGAVPKSYCAQSTTSLLRQVPGFDDITVTFFPKSLMEQIAARPGVQTERYYENDAGDILDGVAAEVF